MSTGGKPRGTWLESHDRSQIHTSGGGLVHTAAATVLGFILVMGTQSAFTLILAGGAIVGVVVWYAWRVIQGALVLHRGRGIG